MILYATRHNSRLFKIDTKTRTLTIDTSSITIEEIVPKDKMSGLITGMTKFATVLGKENYKQRLELLKR